MRPSAAALALVVGVGSVLAWPSSTQAAGVDAADFEQLRAPVFQAGETHDVFVVAWNRGDTEWASTGVGGVYLSYHWRTRTGEVVVWDGLRTALPSPIGPGPRALKMRVLAPSEGDHVLEIAMVREGVSWFGSHMAQVGVFAETYIAALGPGAPPPGEPGERVTIPTRVQNIGSATWNAGGGNPVRVSYHWRDLQGNILVWDGERTAFDRDVTPGEVRMVELSVVLPTQRGMYSLVVELLREGSFWFSAQGPAVASQMVGVPSGFEAQMREGPPDQLTAKPGETVDVTLRVRNLGTRTWPAAGAHPVRLSYHLRGTSGMVVWDGPRAELPSDVPAGGEVTLTLQIAAPAQPDEMVVIYDLVYEGVGWFADIAPKGSLAIGRLSTN